MRKLLLTLSAFLCLLISTIAQNRTITGRVTDAKGQGVSGASVLVRGTRTGTTTLQVSSVDMTTEEVAIRGGSINVTLSASSASNLQEVVVVGYGTRTVRENIGSVSKVAGAKIANEPVSSFEQALAGKTAGVQISLGSGVLADRTAIRIRGINSINQSSQPLIVIDGVPQNDKVTNLNGFNSGNGTRFDPLQLINQNDIESIEVLKDAGASVLYGSRASNGVILITTERGHKGND